jgi:hypothetical protein
MNLRLWWPRVVGVEFVDGDPGTEGTKWTKILQADSSRRMRLDYTCIEATPPSLITWAHELEGTRFGEHLNRQSTSVALAEEGAGCRVTITSDGELKGAAKLASLALKSDQKKMLDQALEALEKALPPVENEV